MLLAVFKYADGVYKKTGEAPFEDAEIGIAGAEVGGNDVIYYWSYTNKLYSYDVDKQYHLADMALSRPPKRVAGIDPRC